MASFAKLTHWTFKIKMGREIREITDKKKRRRRKDSKEGRKIDLSRYFYCYPLDLVALTCYQILHACESDVPSANMQQRKRRRVWSRDKLSCMGRSLMTPGAEELILHVHNRKPM